MSFELTILGSSSALPTSNRNTAAHLLNINERFFLIDCGEGTQIQLRKYKLSLARINHILLSHLHGDHVFGLFGLLSSLGLMGRKADLNLYGPADLESMLQSHLSFFGPLPFLLKYHIAEDGKNIYEDAKIEVRAIGLTHRTHTFGYVFREKERELNIDKACIDTYGLSLADIVKIKRGADHITADGRNIPNSKLTLPPYKSRSYAYITDTLYKPGLADRLQDLDLLFHEATFLDEDIALAKKTLHSTAKQAAEMAKMAGAQKLLLGHFSTRYKHIETFLEQAREVFPESYLVSDGDRFEVEAKRVRRV